MKKIYYITFALLLVLGLFNSCKKFLATSPDDFLSPVNYYQNEEQLNNALYGIYDILGDNALYKQGLYNQLGAGNDLEYYRAFTTNLTATGVRLFNANSSDTYVTNAWNALYLGINRANGLLDAIDAAPVAEARKKTIKAQARFLRGYYYFLLVDNWGGVPLRLSSTSKVNQASMPRASVKEVYEVVLQDMTAAEPDLPTSTQWGPTGSGHISKTTAEGILARVCLTMAGQPLKDIAKYQDAKNWALKVINSGEHALNPDYKQIFINHCKDAYDPKESMWEAEFSWDPTIAHNEYGNVGYANSVKCNNNEYGFCVGDVGVTQKLWNLYSQDPKDVRRDWNIGPYYFSGNDSVKLYYTATQIWNRYPAKWRREYETALPKNKTSTGINFPILRYADVLLMFAEAENQLNGPNQTALDAVNLVRTRAKASGYLLTAFADKTAFHAMIMDERGRELVLEALRRHDLTRWGVLVPVMKAVAADITATAPTAYKFAATAGNNISDRDVLLPIPITELSLNKALNGVNNPGY